MQAKCRNPTKSCGNPYSTRLAGLFQARWWGDKCRVGETETCLPILSLHTASCLFPCLALSTRAPVRQSQTKGQFMKSLRRTLAFSAAFLLLSGCATPPEPGSKDEAVDVAWERFCKSGYCEGFPGRIVGRSENVITVNINGNTRYLTYTVSGTHGNYVAQVRPTADMGRARP